MAGHNFVHFGIPSSGEQLNILISAEAQRLCYDQGSCAADSVSIMLSAFGPLGNLGSMVSLVFDVTRAAFQGNVADGASEIGVEIGDMVVDAAASSAPPVARNTLGTAFPMLDVALDGSGLSRAVAEFENEPLANVSQRAFWAGLSLNSGPMSFHETYFYSVFTAPTGR